MRRLTDRGTLRHTIPIVACLAGFPLLGNAVADDAGMHDFIMNEARGWRNLPAAQPSYVAPPQSFAPLAASRAAHPSRKAIAHIHLRRPPITVAQAELPHKVAVSIFHDRTLRRGDSVMTAQGLRVFRGSERFPYRATDFVALAEGAKFAVGDKKQLREIQLAFERVELPRSRVAGLITGRSVSVAKAMMATTDVDAERKVRYVGP